MKKSGEQFDDEFLVLFTTYFLFKNFAALIEKIEYEKSEKEAMVKGKIKKVSEKAPDLRVQISKRFSFYAEIKHIRDFAVTGALNGLEEYMNATYHPPIPIVGSLRLNGKRYNDQELAKKLESEGFRKELLQFMAAKIGTGSNCFFDSNGYTFDSDITIELAHSRHQDLTDWFMLGASPNLRLTVCKIMDAIYRGLPQVKASRRNIIVVGTFEECFDPTDFYQATKELRGCLKCLNGVLFKCWGPKWHYWSNEKATSPLPKKIDKILQKFAEHQNFNLEDLAP